MTSLLSLLGGFKNQIEDKEPRLKAVFKELETMAQKKYKKGGKVGRPKSKKPKARKSKK